MQLNTEPPLCKTLKFAIAWAHLNWQFNQLELHTYVQSYSIMSQLHLESN